MGVALAAMAITAPAPPPAALGPPHFVEEAEAAGVGHAYDGEFTFFVGGGVAVLDCDDDGRPDLYIAGGSAPSALYRNRSEVGGPLRFERVASAATDLVSVTGAYPLDVDGDRRPDLAVLRYGENVLLRGTGDCGFERANETWDVAGGSSWTAAFSATWEDSARLPTLAFGNYLAVDATGRPSDECAANELVRPGPSGAYEARIALEPAFCSLSVLFSDWDRSGRRDLRISNDRHYYGEASDGQEQLWRIEPGARPRLYTREEGWAKVQIWGMGIASQDLTGDGLPEVYLTSQADNKLQTLAHGPERPAYRDIALRRGVTAHRPFTGGDTRPSTAWHAEFDDVNADGYLDLFVAKGNVEAMPDFAQRDPSNLLLGQPDGTFVEGAAEAGILSFARARGAALTDLNLDGLLDLVVVNRRENVGLYRNVGAGDASRSVAMGHWIAVRPQQPGPNPDAIGSWIEVRAGDRTNERELTIGGGHAGGQLGWTHFGLGTADRAEVRVTWPDGESGPWLTMTADQFGVIERGATEVRPWRP